MSANPATTGVATPKTHALRGPMAWFVCILSVAFVVFLFSIQTGYSILNPTVQKDVGLSISHVSSIA